MMRGLRRLLPKREVDKEQVRDQRNIAAIRSLEVVSDRLEVTAKRLEAEVDRLESKLEGGSP